MEKSQLPSDGQKKKSNIVSKVEDKLKLKFPKNVKEQIRSNLRQGLGDLMIKGGPLHQCKKDDDNEDFLDEESKLEVKVNEIICDITGSDMADLNESLILRDQLKFDSLDFMEFQIKCQDVLGIDVNGQDLQKTKTLGDVYDLCANKLGL